MRELMHNVEHDELEGNDFSTLTPELIERMQKVGGAEYRRLAFEQHFDPAVPVDVVTLTLMQKAASVEDLELYKVAELVNPTNPIELYEQLGGGFKLAGVVDRAKGFKRVGELLSGSRADRLRGAHEQASSSAGKHMVSALKSPHHPEAADKTLKRIDDHARNMGVSHTQAVRNLKEHLDKHPNPSGPQKMRDNIVHAYHRQENKIQATKADRLGKVLKSEQGKVHATRGAAGGAVVAGVAGGVAAARKKDSNK